jgi:hypothetical protein
MPSLVDLSAQDIASHAAIEARLRAALPDISNIYVDGALDQAKVDLFDDGTIRPFLVYWPQLIRRAARGSGRSVAGTRYDSYVGGFDLACVARTGSDSRAYAQFAINSLTGFKPNGNGEIVLEESRFDGSRVVRDSDVLPSRYATMVRATFRMSAQRAS